MLHGHSKSINELSFNPSLGMSHLLLSCSNDFSVRLWDTVKSKLVTTDLTPNPLDFQILLFVDIESQNSELTCIVRIHNNLASNIT